MEPCAQTLRFIEGAEEGGLKYFGICAGPDGMLYCAATAASSVLVIDPRTQTLSFIEGAVGSGLKWSGICASPAGRLFCAPFLSSCDGLRASAYADREHAKAMQERIDGEVQKRWRRSAALVPRKTRYFTEMQTLFGHFKFIPRAGEGGIIGSASSVYCCYF